MLLTTSAGNIELELNSQKEAPVSMKTLSITSSSGFYNSTTFHRVIHGFYDSRAVVLTSRCSRRKPNPPLRILKPTTFCVILAARSRWRAPQIGAAPPAGFFINVADNAFSRPRPATFGYAVFGKKW
ncbi:peptidylprolyl isomerase [Salmonella enterica subsp. enterica]|nr:peptidylprolyl isomerase [Salmonella enterica subsp. enterica]